MIWGGGILPVAGTVPIKQVFTFIKCHPVVSFEMNSLLYFHKIQAIRDQMTDYYILKDSDACSGL